MILAIFPKSYPYDGYTEQTFIGDEIEYLQSQFERVIIFPEVTGGNRLPVNPKIVVNEEYAKTLRRIGKLGIAFRAHFSPLFYRDIIKRPSLLLSPFAMARLAMFAGRAEITRSFLLKAGLPLGETIFYTFWFDSAAMGIALLKEHHKEVRVVSKAHGYDIYEERYKPVYWPCRKTALEMVDIVCPDSEAGTNYLKENYPFAERKIITARLGTNDPGFSTPRSEDRVYRIVSCSFINRIKRLDLLFKGIASAAQSRPDIRIEWSHFGTGDLQNELEKLIATSPSNLKARLMGYSSQADLMTYYRDNPIDVFCNVSSTEGTPVAIMEAISCGIPVIATAVGGNVEIVTPENGWLLSANPPAEEIATTLLKIYEDPALARKKRAASRQHWNSLYNAGKNFSQFSKLLKNIRHGNLNL